MKRIWIALLALTMLLSLAACGEKKQFSDNVAANELADHTLAALSDGVDYTTAQSGYLDDYFLTPSYVSDATVRFATDANNLNEFGIFHVSSDKVKDMETLLKDYLKKSYEANQAWYDSYIPAETPKLRDAEVKRIGNYVLYAIASPSDRTAFFEAAEAKLTE